MDLRELSVTAKSDDRHPWEQVRVDVVEYLLKQRGSAAARETILDFGCGDAYLANSLTERFPQCEVFAVDKAFTDDVKIRVQPGLGKRTRLFDSVPAVESAHLEASLVLLLDVLEHCEDDLAVLEKLVESPAVLPGARFLLTVPAFQGLFSKHDDFLGHYRRYKLSELAAVAERAGLRVIDQSYFFSTLLLPRSVTVLLEKMRLARKQPTGIGGYKTRPVFDKMVKSVLWADFRVCKALARTGIYLPGLSCFVMAEKPSTAANS